MTLSPLRREREQVQHEPLELVQQYVEQLDGRLAKAEQLCVF